MVLGLLQCLATTSCHQLSVTSFAWRENRERERDWDVCFIVMEAWKGRGKRTLQEEKGSGFFQTLLWF